LTKEWLLRVRMLGGMDRAGRTGTSQTP